MQTNPLTEDSTEVGTWHTAKLRGTMNGEEMKTTSETNRTGKRSVSSKDTYLKYKGHQCGLCDLQEAMRSSSPDL